MDGVTIRKLCLVLSSLLALAFSASVISKGVLDSLAPFARGVSAMLIHFPNSATYEARQYKQLGSRTTQGLNRLGKCKTVRC